MAWWEAGGVSQAGQRSIDGSGLHCRCRRPYLGELMLACEECDSWWHPACLGLDPDMCAASDDPWWCADCSRRRRGGGAGINAAAAAPVAGARPTVHVLEGFVRRGGVKHPASRSAGDDCAAGTVAAAGACAADDGGDAGEYNCVCRQPVEAWAGEPMVCCDQCEVWYHTACIGMPKEVYEELITAGDHEWFCHQCAAADDTTQPPQHPPHPAQPAHPTLASSSAAKPVHVTVENAAAMLQARVMVQWSQREAYSGVITAVSGDGWKVRVRYDDGEVLWEPLSSSAGAASDAEESTGSITVLALPDTSTLTSEAFSTSVESESAAGLGGNTNDVASEGVTLASGEEREQDEVEGHGSSDACREQGGGYGGADVRTGELICRCRVPFSSDMLVVRCTACQCVYHPPCVGLAQDADELWNGQWRCAHCPRYGTRKQRKPTCRAAAAAAAAATRPQLKLTPRRSTGTTGAAAAAATYATLEAGSGAAAEAIPAVGGTGQRSQSSRPRLRLSRPQALGAAPSLNAATGHNTDCCCVECRKSGANATAAVQNTGQISSGQSVVTSHGVQGEAGTDGRTAPKFVLGKRPITSSSRSSSSSSARETECDHRKSQSAENGHRGSRRSALENTALTVGKRQRGGARVRRRGSVSVKLGAGAAFPQQQQQQPPQPVLRVKSSAVAQAALDSRAVAALRGAGKLKWRFGKQRAAATRAGGSSGASTAHRGQLLLRLGGNRRATTTAHSLINTPGIHQAVGGGSGGSAKGGEDGAAAAAASTAAAEAEQMAARFCAVCLSEGDELEDPVMTPCRHWFCRPCLVRSSEECGRRCPLCRRSIFKFARALAKKKGGGSSARMGTLQN